MPFPFSKSAMQIGGAVAEKTFFRVTTDTNEPLLGPYSNRGRIGAWFGPIHYPSGGLVGGIH